ncbi:MAG: efflux RND transporter permease subunit [Dysgonamonadaceae bacterium]|jgi:multidrug efflux pump subunit AcrB|nr:efflux RND transporter permease subunit [Dysgonamonadaceae bacterium]
MKVSSFSIILAFACLTLVGLALIPRLPVKLSPSQALPQINVSFSMPGNASRVVEMEATSKLESMLNRIKGIQNIASTSGNGWGRINVSFDKHADLDAVRFEASTIIRQTWPFLPEGTSYPVISLNRSDNDANRPFLSYTVNAPANPIVIQQFTESNIKPKLAQIPGVNQIIVSGAMPMEWKVEYDYKILETLGLNVQNIQSAITNYLSREFLGTASIETSDGETQWIRVALAPELETKHGFDPANIQVKNVNGKLISLDKVVTVGYLEQDAQSYYRINGLNSIYMSIKADENANQLELSQLIKKELEAIELIFPAGYEMHLGYDATEYIKDELDKIYFRTSLTLIILLLFVMMIYRNLKYLLLISISLFINISIAVIFYYFLGLEMQLYSLAGITISLTLVIDNTIVMSDQIIRRNNKNAYFAILTATITTIASLVIIFFMDEKIRLNLLDFAWVIIINLSVSLFVALFLVPALLEKLKIGKGQKAKNKRRIRNRLLSKLPFAVQRCLPVVRPKRMNVYFNRFYAVFCRFTWRWRVPVCILIILVFGLPVFLLPEKVNDGSQWGEIYNKTLGSNIYKEKIKSHTDKYLGGTLRLFVQKVFQGSYFKNREQTSVYVTATLPNGSTVSQMNNLIQKMEVYISQFNEVKQFQTSVQSARRASINIDFTKESERTGFPYLLKSKLISKAIELGGGSWGVYGLGDGFNNNVSEMAGSSYVVIQGFNYDELYELAEKFKEELLENRRIKEVLISSEYSWYKDDYQEFMFDLDPERLAQENMLPIQLFASLKPMFGQKINAGQIPGEYGLERIVLNSRQSEEYDVWSLEHVPGRIGKEKEYKLKELATVQKSQAPQDIVKKDQQYLLGLQYEYIGSNEQGKKFLTRCIDKFRTTLPMGYTIEDQARGWSWGRDNSKQYWLILLIFVIIYFTCSVLFNSLKQPLSVIFVIPIAFIGIFLTFYLFKLNFDQGGFASFVLLCGIAVNVNIYVMNEYNNILRKRKINPLKAYIKAWNAKISPIFLTVVSTILGFIPFMIGEYKEAFWFPLAAGTIGGMVTSLIGSFCFLPLFMGVAKNEHKIRKFVP